MSVSSTQHRSLRQIISGVFTLMLVMAATAWLFIEKSIDDNLLKIASDNNTFVASMIGDLVLLSPGNKLDKTTLKSFEKLSVEQVLKTQSYSNILVVVNRYLKKHAVSKINLITPSGKIIFSTNPQDVARQIDVFESFRAATQGKAGTLQIFDANTAARYHVKRNTLLSYVPVIKQQGTDVNEVLFIIELNTDISSLVDKISYFKIILIAGLLAGLVILLAIFIYLAKYSDSLVNKYARQIVTQAKSDPVTGLLNRHHFFRTLKQSVRRTIQQNGRSALLIIDIDHFKEINARYDHTFGDEVLKIIVQRLNRIISPADTLARTGDDEFSVLVEQFDSRSYIQDVAQKILKKINAPIQIDANYIHLTVSIGISVINEDAREMETLVQHADAALYNAKDFGRNNFQFFSRGGGSRHIRFYEKQYSLNKALEDNEFVLFIQPKVNGSSGKIVGGEILLRWDNPDYGMVQPLEFLPALETSGLIHNVGNWVLQETCKIGKRWKDNGMPAVPLSVNVSALQFKKESFVINVSEALRSSGLEGNMLEMELTETCLMDNVEYSLHILQNLKDIGIRIAIDDFGTGYSSLNYLKRFPIDVLKIDRSFIQDVNNRENNDNAAIVTAIMALSHSLHLEAVAEGIETAEELAYLNALGCKIIQGFLFSKPLPLDEFEALLKNQSPLQEIIENVRKHLA